MNKELNLQQANLMLDYLKHAQGTNVEVLSGLVLLFCRVYLDMMIAEMQAKK